MFGGCGNKSKYFLFLFNFNFFTKISDVANILATSSSDPMEDKKLILESALLKAPLSTNVRVPGNIHRPEYFNFWKDTLKADKFVLSTLKEGYKLPFREIPPEYMEPNNRSALESGDFLLQELLRLEELGCISRVSERPHLVLPCSVVFSNKVRLVVDASRALNPFLEDRPVKLTSLEKANDGVPKDAWGSTQDLDSGYYHVSVAQEHRKYLGVHFVDPRTGKTLF